MISILWVSLYQTPRRAAIEELQQESIQMDTKETPTSSAMTWQQQQEETRDYCAISRSLGSVESRGMQPSP